MKKYLMIGVAAAAFAATGAGAVAPLTSAAIEGVTDATGAVTTGTVWDTTVNGFYLAVLQQPLGTILNGNDPASISVPSVLGVNDFAVSGDGWPTTPGNVNNSDLFYRLTLGFGDGSVISGVYDTVNNDFFGGPTSGNFTLTGFLWERQRFNIVSEYSSTKGGSPADYQGGFSYVAVPEPATWAMMIGGFGMVGAAMRRRKAQVRVTYA